MVWEFHTAVFYDAKSAPEIWVRENSNLGVILRQRIKELFTWELTFLLIIID